MSGTLRQITRIAPDRAKQLSRHGRGAIRAALAGQPSPRFAETWAAAPAATFVTLRRGQRLHGCIGDLTPRHSLARSVAENSVAAALRDPRARALSTADVDALHFELSILGPFQRLDERSLDDVVQALRPGRDCVLLRTPSHRGVFLPQVWEHFDEPMGFLRALRAKAGLPRDYWSDDLEVLRCDVDKHLDAPVVPLT